MKTPKGKLTRKKPEKSKPKKEMPALMPRKKTHLQRPKLQPLLHPSQNLTRLKFRSLKSPLPLLLRRNLLRLKLLRPKRRAPLLRRQILLMLQLEAVPSQRLHLPLVLAHTLLRPRIQKMLQ
jgi:hypothetical protein